MRETELLNCKLERTLMLSKPWLMKLYNIYTKFHTAHNIIEKKRIQQNRIE